MDLAPGLWGAPLPMDIDGDGVNDLLVNSTGKPSNGLWSYRNVGTNEEPLFEAPDRLSAGRADSHISYVDGEPVVTTPNRVYPDVAETGFLAGEAIGFDGTVHEPDLPDGRLRGDQWYMVDYDDDGALDVVVGVGDWSEYGWDAAFDDEGNWTNGPLHGYVYLLRNAGTTDVPRYEDPVKIEAAGDAVDVYGTPSPVVADFTGDGDLDLVTGEFRDEPTFFENVGTRADPQYAAGKPVQLTDGGTLALELEMIVVSAIDWDGDGDTDLVIGEEDGRVSLVENTGDLDDGAPVFEPPVYFQQEATHVKVGALSTPSGVDWNGDGRQDLLVGDSAGFVSYVENLGGDDATPSWAAPVRLEADGTVIHHQAGPNGSVQGPAEEKWGYTSPTAADWNGDGLPDVIVNDIWGRVVWYENVGTRTEPELAAAQPVTVQWDGATPKPAWNWWDPQGDELVVQWRTTPVVRDIDGDGLTDLVMTDHEGYLAFYERVETDDGLALRPGERIFIGEEGSSVFEEGRGDAVDAPEGPIRMNQSEDGASGRRKIAMGDWTGDGRTDLIINGTNAQLLENVGDDDEPWLFRLAGDISNGTLAGHTTSPALVNWDGEGPDDLLLGAEDGVLYLQPWNGGDRPDDRWGTPSDDPADLVGSWSFDEGEGHVAQDGSGNGNHGVVDGATWVEGHTGTGLRLDAFNDYVDLSHTVAPFLADAPGITASAWVRPDSLDSGAQRIFGSRIDGGRAGFEVTFENANARARIAVAARSESGDSYRKLRFDTPSIHAGEWHQVTAVADFEKDLVRLYVDGVEVSASSDPQAVFGADAYDLGTPSQPDTIGRSPDGSSYLRGTVDDVQVYRVARDQRDVLLDLVADESSRWVATGDLPQDLGDQVVAATGDARASLAAGDDAAARERVAQLRDELAAGPDAAGVTAPVAALVASADEYLLRADPPSAQCSTADGEPVPTWRSAPAAPRDANEVAQQGFADETIRMVARADVGGCGVRVRLSNEFGTEPVTFDKVSVGERSDGPLVDQDTLVPVTFDSGRTITIPPGEEAVSDVVDLPVGDRAELAVSAYTSGATGPATTHNLARETGFVAPGDHADDAGGDGFLPATTSWMFLSGIDVVRADPTPTVVAVGDSLTDGLGTSLGAEKTWPDQLGDRFLVEQSGAASVVNRGMSAGRLLRDAAGSESDPASLPGAISRLDRDLDDASTAVLLIGINDIIQGQQGEDPVSADDLVAGYEEYVEEAHARGVRVVGATLTPYGGSRNFTEAGEAVRQEANEWIRSSGAFDAVVDLDAAVRDADAPRRIDRRYDLGEGLHLNDAGHRAMSEAFDLDVLLGEPGALSVEAEARCLAGTAYVAVRAVNDGDEPVDVALRTEFGTHVVESVEPGASAYQSFSARAASVPTGTVSAVVPGGEPVEVELAAVSCD
ncbi:VCBS repeat-containing protein [Cellulosimicrobium arenosum]|uniref:VCBS repeat-containing protein n=1 Tax=Cellulosimicrobium arenosum TaxID=2708133 RepID=A0A927IZI2_9MICO|nr:VCBS repeat-containing protein [Cellulosimicrobium arenosum]